MSYNFQIRKSLENGKKKEQEFVEAARYVDINDHWDVGTGDLKFDVKSTKRINRTDSSLSTDYHWIELLNVSGKAGWLFGKADAFAFECGNSLSTYWVCVRRVDLIDFVMRHIDISKWGKEPFGLYRRSGRKDLITMIPVQDLFYLAFMVIRNE